MVGWLVIFVVWLGAIVFGVFGLRNAYRGDDELQIGLIIAFMKAYSRVVHRVRVVGREHAVAAERAHAEGRPVIVASNHTAGVDPVLVQAGLNFEPRWMMASDMRVAGVDWFWELGRIIFVDREAKESRSLRVAMRHLKDGGVLGIFPEAHLERPPRRLLPFKPGIGMMVRSSKALVLPVLIDGAPQADPAWSSLWTPSGSSVTFLEPVDYHQMGLMGEQIADDLRERMAAASGWPRVDRAPIFANGERFLIDLEGRYYDDRTGERVTDDEVRRRTTTDGEG